MGASIGPRIGIDGESEFRQQIKNINAVYRALEAETRAVTSAFEANGDQQGKLEATSKQLEKQLSNQREKMALLESAVEKAVGKFGEGSLEATRLNAALNDTKATIAGLEAELSNNNQQLERMASGVDSAEAEFQKSLASIKAVDDHLSALEAETRAVTAAYEANGDKQGALKAASFQLERQLEDQRSKLKLLETALRQAAAQYGDNSTEAIRLNTDLNKTKTAISKLETELEDIPFKLALVEHGMDNLGDTTDNAGDKVLDFSDILGANLVSDLAMDGLQKLEQLVMDFVTGMPDAAAEVKAAGSQFEQAFGNLEEAAKSSLETISEDTNIATTRMQGSFTKIFAFAKTAGVESSLALEIAGRALVAAADNAAYYDKSIEEVTETLQSFLKGNYENDAALGVSCTETTRNAAANALYAQSFNDLSEAQKQLTLLKMVEEANALSGAIGQAARESDSWANVSGELAEAWKQLQAAMGDPAMQAAIPVIQDIVDLINKLLETSDWDNLDNSIDAFAGSMEQANAQYTESVAGAESAAFAAEQYLSRLTELEQAGLNTAQSQYEYGRIIEELNALIPGLNLSINDQTGLLEQNKGAVQGDVSAWLETQKIAALQQKLTSQTQARVDAENALMEARFQLSNAESEGLAIEDALAAKGAELTAAGAELNAVLSQQPGAKYAAAAGAKDLSQQESALQEQVDKLGDEYLDLDSQLKENARNQDKLNTAITEGETTVAQYDSEIAQTSMELESYGYSCEIAAQGQGTLQNSMSETEKVLQSLEMEYQAGKIAARESLDSQIGLFDQLTLKSKMSASQIIANWASQQQALDNYSANLQKAIDMGLDESLVQQLSDGSTESMAYLNELVNSTNVSVDEINEAFRSMSEAKDAASEAMNDITSEVKTELEALKEEAYAGGVNAGEGIAEGAASTTDSVTNAFANLAKAGVDAYNEYMVIKSPSRRMKGAAKDTVDGAVIGVDENVRRFEASMRSMARAGQDAFFQERLDNAMQYPSIVNMPSTTSQQTSSHIYGDTHISIYQQPGEDSEALAYRLMDIMQAEKDRKESAL